MAVPHDRRATSGPKRLAVLGSTGSLGIQVLELCERFADRLQVVALAASGRRQELLGQQVRRFRPQLVAVGDATAPIGDALRDAAGAARVVHGPDGLVEAAVHPDVDLVVVLTVGMAGLAPTLAALEAGKRVALGNKEVLVAAGELLPGARLVAEGRLLPVDSEHSAVWQSLLGERHALPGGDGGGEAVTGPGAIRRLWLTASGGPFWGWSAQRLRSVTPEQALAHPTWRMGPRVTIDSATLVNKGFEIIEAHHLFGVPYPAIRVVVHRQSVVHSLVELRDGSIKAQMSLPDMRLPLLFALSHPERWEYRGPAPLFEGHAPERGPLSLTFEPLDEATEPPAIRLARRAAEAGSTYPAVLSTADEVAVEAFLAGRLAFDRILPVVQETLDGHVPARVLSLEAVRWADDWARRTARRVVEEMRQA
ncbi:1-deoxy-D-xylulose-5-phosphate reductoisomerase [Geochorda subterranea]|uniref:1-deoxy-D-xylulose 5-phosphate reductoisomerase n=1 Tax=Geochorda subterranea TaxID=3109564 RepID=A0ABZ1BNN5_9FIRM|nr:1-deoxy-D-xylulose-5-phosphate reductoisomerase [Limnochorda sp. LNt]WRP14041.1 1-deoxy-D-xylulose-5-phosphate reductoisomerase [Limnochorda sp. LNt]